jgi:class 3 adenylate cyclase
MFLLRRLSIQSRLVVLLLFVSISSILVVGYVAHRSGTEVLKQRTFSRLEGLRRIRTERIRDRMSLIRNQVVGLSEGEKVASAAKDFRAAFAKLASCELSPTQMTELRTFYQKDFLPRLQRNTDGEPLLDTYFPTRASARYLQYHYIAKNPHPPGLRDKLDMAGDGSDYSAFHAKYHPFFCRFASRYGYDDILLINPDNGDVLYSCDKSTELGRNLYTGPYAQSNLSQLVRSLRKHGDRRTFRTADFETYLPNLGQPAAFVASPIFDGPKRVGILVFQFPIDAINRIVTGNNGWERDGLGKTGEAIVVGSDHLLRSTTRFMINDPEEYLRSLRKAGYSPAAVERIRRFGSPILQQAVHGKAIDDALLGQEGMQTFRDYRGVEVLASYAPLEIEGLHWVIVAKMDVSEVYAPTYELGKKLLLTLVVVSLMVSVFAVIVSSLYVRPITQICQGVRAVSTGNTDVTVTVNSNDEMRELADAFNDMTRNLRTKTEQLEQKIRENEELLLNILPRPAAMRLRDGEQQVTDTYADVTVLFADLVGFSELDAQMPADEVVKLHNDLIVIFDELAERFGVEKIKTMGMSYLAVCGLSVARVDHANRMVEFAQEMLRVVRRFNQDRGTTLSLRIGINAGPVVGGVVGRSKFIYELWGATVSTARGLKSQGLLNTIQLSPTVQERLRDLYEFERQPELQTPGQKPLTVWTIKSAA